MTMFSQSTTRTEVFSVLIHGHQFSLAIAFVALAFNSHNSKLLFFILRSIIK